jgi:hypothetical protein
MSSTGVMIISTGVMIISTVFHCIRMIAFPLL